MRLEKMTLLSLPTPAQFGNHLVSMLFLVTPTHPYAFVYAYVLSVTNKLFDVVLEGMFMIWYGFPSYL